MCDGRPAASDYAISNRADLRTTLTGPADNGIATGATTALTTALTTAIATSTTTARTRTTRTTAAATTDANGRPLTTTGPRVVGQQETMAPMRTTTYWYDPGNGVWTVATWTATVTAEPTVATYIPPAGTVADYDSYQSEVNGNLFASAKGSQAANLASGSTGAAGKRAAAGLAVIVGAVGIGAAVVGF